jgi:hypothetical protein
MSAFGGGGGGGGELFLISAFVRKGILLFTKHFHGAWGSVVVKALRY